MYDGQCSGLDTDDVDEDEDIEEFLNPVTFLPPTEFAVNPIENNSAPNSSLPPVPQLPAPGNTTPTMPTIPGTPGSGSSAEPVDGSGAWGAFPTIPSGGFYERSYTSLQDVYSEFQGDLAETQFATFLDGFNLPEGSGEAPVLLLDFTEFMGFDLGSYDVSPPEWVWVMFQATLYLLTFIACRKIIFGG
jgi:hypothetical protein